jgi:hypothetical protein
VADFLSLFMAALYCTTPVTIVLSESWRGGGYAFCLYGLYSVTSRHAYIISPFIISMTKLLDADWLRGVQLFH